jgi:hypothetical protein
MTTWNDQQVRAMESYRFSQLVQNEVLWRAGWEIEEDDPAANPAFRYVIDHLFHALREAGRTWAVEIHRDDCEYVATPEPDIDATNITLRWAPSTRAGLLIGGPAGGTVYQFAEDLHRRGVRVQVLDHTQGGVWNVDPDAPLATITAPVVKEYYYQWAGWSESRRMWVYRVAA